jgi:dienelactone hydrolase
VADDDAADFERDTFSHDGKTRSILRLGTGPAVIVIAEMPGVTPNVLAFARRVAAIGCSAVLPHLFGEPGRDPDPASSGRSRFDTARYGLSSIVPACVSREFAVLATGKTSPIVEWLRPLAASEHERCGGPGVGAVGMCFTGGFALAMATEPSLLAPVLAQPSLPLALTAKQKRSIDTSPDDLAIVRRRCMTEGLRVLGLRFEGDRFVPKERFDFLREQLGDGFVAVELPDDCARSDAMMAPHSVLTEHLVDEPGEPTRDALEQVLDLFRARLVAGT